MDKVIGVRFAKTGKLYYMDPLKFDVKVGDKVIANSERGQEIGRVVSIKTMEEFKKIGYDNWVSAEMLPPYTHYPETIIYNTSNAMDKILGRK